MFPVKPFQGSLRLYDQGIWINVVPGAWDPMIFPFPAINARSGLVGSSSTCTISDPYLVANDRLRQAVCVWGSTNSHTLRRLIKRQSSHDLEHELAFVSMRSGSPLCYLRFRRPDCLDGLHGLALCTTASPGIAHYWWGNSEYLRLAIL